ncbi:MAG: 4'-phosphopantetheinyl transferase superfamily protein, partial [Bdellovibrio sp.]|nr:4'-phosphopantetheinyl transferase superfamily protein [Bdellovibrio sp.]
GRGRPRLDHAALDVNWSHSGDGLLVASGAGVRVGVDLERVHARPRALDLARRFFAPAERAWLQAQPAGMRDAAFLRLWCAKEACFKALRAYQQPSVISEISIGAWQNLDSQTETYRLLNSETFNSPSRNHGFTVHFLSHTYSFFIFPS